MRDFSSCLSEYAVDVSDTSCSSYSNRSCISVSPSSAPSIQTSVTCCYRTVLSTQKRVSITVTWSRNTTLPQSLTISFAEEDQEEEEENQSNTTFKLNTNPRLFKKLKGTKTLLPHATKIEIFWDLSSARYQTRPEPVSGYCILVTIDAEPGLILGDSKKLKNGTVKPAKSSLLSRREYFSGNSTHYSTKARFCDSGGAHDISIRCVGEDEGGVKHPVLCVCVDRKMVMRVKRLKWNFRGNQTIFLDGLLVDLMWDVHDWFYSPVSANGNAVFMFRTRSGLDNRLWRLDQKATAQKDGDVHEFSLMIYACKNT